MLAILQSATAATVPWLKTSGNQIVTVDGRSVTLRGANIGRSEWLFAWGINMDAENRGIPILHNQWKGNVFLRGFASDPVNSGNASYLELLDQHVRLAEANSMYVIFSWRSHEINGEQLNMPDDRAQNALAILAQRYKGIPNVIYSLQVEPHNVTWATLKPRFTQMVDAIQAVSEPYKPIIMVPGTNWSRNLGEAITNPIVRQSIVYKTHPYNDKGLFQSEFLDAYDAGLPVFIGEFGYSPSLNMDMDDVNTLMEIARSRNIGWTAWLFDYQGPPTLVTNINTFDPTFPYGAAVKDQMMTTPPLPSDVVETVPPVASITSPLTQWPSGSCAFIAAAALPAAPLAWLAQLFSPEGPLRLARSSSRGRFS